MSNYFIFDSEYFFLEKYLPNYKTMKIYSYHKQKKDNVFLIHDASDLATIMPEDICYAIKEEFDTPYPPLKIMERRNLICMGEALTLEDTYKEFPLYVAAVRPAYDIYKKPSPYNNCEMVLYQYKGSLIEVKQEEKRFNTKFTVVCDDNLWVLEDSKILKILEELKEKNKVFFLKPVILDIFIKNQEIYENFLKIHLFEHLHFNFKLLSNKEEDVQKAIEILKEIKKKNKAAVCGGLNVKILLHNHWKDRTSSYNDFMRCLKLGSYSREIGFKLNFIYPIKQLSSPLWTYFEFFKRWSLKPNHSYARAMLETTTKALNIPYYEVLNQAKYWKLDRENRVVQMIYLLNDFPEEMKKYAFNGKDGIDEEYYYLDWDSIKENYNKYLR